MEINDIMRRMGEEKLIAVLRMQEGLDTVLETCAALLAGGLTIIEVTCSVPDALEAVRSLASREGRSYLVGAGTVLDAATAEAMAGAGADFVVSPAVIEEVIEASRRCGAAVIPGALTPTEVWHAHSRGADAVKVFPASLVGPSYLRDLAAPLPGVRLIPTGGVDLDNLAGFIAAGAFAVGVGSSLIDLEAAARGDWEKVTAQAARFVQVTRDALARSELARRK